MVAYVLRAGIGDGHRLRRPADPVHAEATPADSAGSDRDGEKTLWNISRPGDTIVIELLDEDLQRLVLTVDAPRDVAQAINNAARAA